MVKKRLGVQVWDHQGCIAGEWCQDDVSQTLKQAFQTVKLGSTGQSGSREHPCWTALQGLAAAAGSGCPVGPAPNMRTSTPGLTARTSTPCTAQVVGSIMIASCQGSVEAANTSLVLTHRYSAKSPSIWRRRRRSDSRTAGAGLGGSRSSVHTSGCSWLRPDRPCAGR